MNNRFAFLPMRTANDLLGDDEGLRQQMDEDGYLLFRRVLEQETVRNVRSAITETLARVGWVEPPRILAPSRCLVTPLRENDDAFPIGYDEVQKLEAFHALAHEPDLLAIMRSVMGETAFPHPLKIARLAFPDHYEATTPPHQDFPNNQGTTTLTAAWIPVVDMPAEMGGLAVLRGSHRWGPLPLARHLGAGNRTSVIPPEMLEECRWVTTEFEMGDVLLFPSLTVHAALHNASELSMRLSVDFRYQLEGEPLTAGCLEPHFQRLSWDDIYRDWKSDEFKYYWRDLDYSVVPFEVYPLVDHDLESEFTKEEMRQIYYYHERVEARTARRLAAMGTADDAEALI